jgi:4-carboxymuconolactone decarboxylase
MNARPARVPVPRPEELREDAAKLLPLIAPAGREPARTMAILALQPDLLQPFLGWAAALALNGVLGAREHEVLALRTAWNCASEFEWSEHVEYARDAGLDDDKIADIARPVDPRSWSARERALLRVADELHAATDVSEATWDDTATLFDVPTLVEMIFVVGQYTMLSMVANAAGLEAPPGSSPMPEKVPR